MQKKKIYKQKILKNAKEKQSNRTVENQSIIKKSDSLDRTGHVSLRRH